MLIPHYATSTGAAGHVCRDMSLLLFVLDAVATYGNYLLFIYDKAMGKKRDHSLKYKRDIWKIPAKFGWSDKGVYKLGVELVAGYQVKAEWKDSWRPTVKIKKNGKLVHNFGLNSKETKEKPAKKLTEELAEQLAKQLAEQLAEMLRGKPTEILHQYDANRQIILEIREKCEAKGSEGLKAVIKVDLRHLEPSANLASAPDVSPPLMS